MLIIDKIFTNTTYPFFTIIANYLGLGAFSTSLNELTHTWFIGYILICYLITPLLDLIFKNKKNKKYIFLIISMSILLHFFNIINVNSAYICNYILGFWFAKCLGNKEKNKFSIIIILISLLTLPLKIITAYNLISIPSIISNYSTYIWDWTHTFIGISIFVILYKLFHNKKNKYNKILLFSDKYSFYIYLTHQIFILNKFSLLHISNNIIINILLILICIIISGITLNKLSVMVELLINKLIILKQNKKWD